MLFDLTDDEISNLRWLLQALGCDPSVQAINILTVARGPWAIPLYAKLADSKVPPAMSLDDLRLAFGRFAADNTTAQEVADLRAVIDDQNAEIVKVQSLLSQLQGVATDVTAVAATPLAQEVAAIRPATVP